MKHYLMLGLFLFVSMLLFGCGASTPEKAVSQPAKSQAPSVSVPAPPPDGAASTTDVRQSNSVPMVSPDKPAEGETASDKPKEPEIPDRIARVGNEDITGKEYLRDLKAKAARLSALGDTSADPNNPIFRAQTLQEMIDARVLRIVATQAVTVPDDAVEKEFQRGRRLIGSEEKFKEYLKSEDMDETGLRKEIRDRMAVQEYTKKKTADVTVTDDEIKARYDVLEAEGKTRRIEKTADIQHIAVYAPSGQQAEKDGARKKIDDARARILAGEPFETIAREISDDRKADETGGFYPETSQSIMQDYIATRMFSQPVGELSEPFEGGGGWHLMKVISVNDPGPIPLERAKDRISRLVLDSKKREIMAGDIDRAKYIVHVEIHKSDIVKAGKQEDKKAPDTIFDPANAKMPTTVPLDLQKKMEENTGH